MGAIVAPKRHLQTVIKALDEKQWRKKRVRVAGHDGDDTLMVAVAPEGARVLNAFGAAEAAEQVPATLAQLLRDGTVRWATGIRHPGAVTTNGSADAPGTSGSATDGPPARFRYAELFAGIGGFRLALDALGGRCAFASEICPCAAATYERNFGERPSGDITEVEDAALPAHELLTAGFPCQ